MIDRYHNGLGMLGRRATTDGLSVESADGLCVGDVGSKLGTADALALGNTVGTAVVLGARPGSNVDTYSISVIMTHCLFMAYY